jgi:hypothetical protein
MTINLYAAWTGFFLGCVAGAVTGLFFIPAVSVTSGVALLAWRLLSP